MSEANKKEFALEEVSAQDDLALSTAQQPGRMGRELDEDLVDPDRKLDDDPNRAPVTQERDGESADDGEGPSNWLLDPEEAGFYHGRDAPGKNQRPATESFDKPRTIPIRRLSRHGTDIEAAANDPHAGKWSPEGRMAHQPTEIPWQSTFTIGMGIDLSSPDGNFGTGVSAFMQGNVDIHESTEISSSGLRKILVRDSDSLTRTIESSLEAEGGGWGYAASASTKAASNLSVTKESVHATVYAYCIMTPSMARKGATNGFVFQETATRLLTKDPAEFRAVYGSHFVAGYKKGATFFGKMTFNSTKSKSTRGVSSSVQGVAAHLGSIGANTEFKKILRKSSTTCTTDFVGTGGSVVSSGVCDGDMTSLIRIAEETVHGKKPSQAAEEHAKADDENKLTQTNTSAYKKITGVVYPYSALAAYRDAVAGKDKNRFEHFMSNETLKELSTCFLWYGKLEQVCRAHTGQRRHLVQPIEKLVYGEYEDRIKGYTRVPVYDNYTLGEIREFRHEIIGNYEEAIKNVGGRGVLNTGGSQRRNFALFRCFPFNRRQHGKMQELGNGSFAKEGEKNASLIILHKNKRPSGIHMNGAYLACRLDLDRDVRNRVSCYVCAVHRVHQCTLWETEDIGHNEFYLRMVRNVDRTGFYAKGWYLGV